MKILTIETTGHFASVALGNLQIKNDTDYSHLREITPMCMEIIGRAGIKAAELDAVAVSRGPGSFTGIRIGMATAKGLSQIWDKPIICAPTLDSFMYREGLEDDSIVIPVFDARREQVYAGIYKGRDVLLPGAAYDIDYFRQKVDDMTGTEHIHFFGDGSSLIGRESEGAQEANQILRLAEIMFAGGQTETCYSAEPEYMRISEAERILKEKQNEK